MVDTFVIYQLYQGYIELMVWACFTFDFKGPIHILLQETAAERQLA